jgi:hypothetical protein
MKKIRRLIDYFKNVDPCGAESTCVVRPACHMLQTTPWLRTSHCPAYMTYVNRRDMFRKIISTSADWFWIIFTSAVFMFILFMFLLGIMKFIELLNLYIF